MKTFYGFRNFHKSPKTVLALGVFDGVHYAHKKILAAAVRKAKQIKGTSVALTFWPHPKDKESIYSLDHRLNLISKLGIDKTIVINFNKRFSSLEAEDFIRIILADKIGARYIYVGRNFRFGRGAEGTCATLKKLSGEYDFEIKIFDIIKTGSRPISSTFIRNLISRGRIKDAKKLLSRPVSILGTVIKGVSWGKKLGFPTANLDAHHEVLPACGVYAAKAILDNKIFSAICYIGKRPDFLRLKSKAKKSNSKNIEVHIFNFHKNIYGKFLEVQFIKKIREARKFTAPKPLINQIKKDVSIAKKLLSHL